MIIEPQTIVKTLDGQSAMIREFRHGQVVETTSPLTHGHILANAFNFIPQEKVSAITPEDIVNRGLIARTIRNAGSSVELSKEDAQLAVQSIKELVKERIYLPHEVAELLMLLK